MRIASFFNLRSNFVLIQTHASSYFSAALTNLKQMNWNPGEISKHSYVLLNRSSTYAVVTVICGVLLFSVFRLTQRRNIPLAPPQPDPTDLIEGAGISLNKLCNHPIISSKALSKRSPPSLDMDPFLKDQDAHGKYILMGQGNGANTFNFCFDNRTCFAEDIYIYEIENRYGTYILVLIPHKPHLNQPSPGEKSFYGVPLTHWDPRKGHRLPFYVHGQYYAFLKTDKFKKIDFNPEGWLAYNP